MLELLLPSMLFLMYLKQNKKNELRSYFMMSPILPHHTTRCSGLWGNKIPRHSQDSQDSQDLDSDIDSYIDIHDIFALESSLKKTIFWIWIVLVLLGYQKW